MVEELHLPLAVGIRGFRVTAVTVTAPGVLRTFILGRTSPPPKSLASNLTGVLGGSSPPTPSSTGGSGDAATPGISTDCLLGAAWLLSTLRGASTTLVTTSLSPLLGKSSSQAPPMPPPTAPLLENSSSQAPPMPPPLPPSALSSLPRRTLFLRRGSNSGGNSTATATGGNVTATTTGGNATATTVGGATLRPRPDAAGGGKNCEVSAGASFATGSCMGRRGCCSMRGRLRR